MKHGMHRRILDLLPNIRTDDFDLRLRHPKMAGEESVGEGFETLHNLEVIPSADFFLQFPISEPLNPSDRRNKCIS